MHTAEKLLVIVQTAHANVQAEVLTCEDLRTHRYAQVTFVAGEVSEVLAARPSYPLSKFSRAAWERAFDVELSLSDPAAARPDFMVHLSINRVEEPRSLKFYTQQIEEHLQQEIERQFARPSHYYKIGDGFPKPSKFNLAFGKRLIGRQGHRHNR